MAYPIGILVLLSFDVIPKPIDVRMFGPTYMPWRKALDFVIGGPADYVRDTVLMIVVPLLIVKGRNGLFLFLYLCAVWLLCLNPLLAHLWMKNVFAYCYFRLVYLLQLPLLFAMLGAAGSQLVQAGQPSKSRSLTLLALLLLFVSCFYTCRGLSIMPRDPKLGIGWKSPREYQLLPANTDFAKAAGRYIAHAKLLAPGWTASCELPLLFPEMKVVAPRLVRTILRMLETRMKAFSAARRRLLSRETSPEISNGFDCWNRNFAKSSKLVGQMRSPLRNLKAREFWRRSNR